MRLLHFGVTSSFPLLHFQGNIKYSFDAVSRQEAFFESLIIDGNEMQITVIKDYNVTVSTPMSIKLMCYKNYFDYIFVYHTMKKRYSNVYLNTKDLRKDELGLKYLWKHVEISYSFELLYRLVLKASWNVYSHKTINNYELHVKWKQVPNTNEPMILCYLQVDRNKNKKNIKRYLLKIRNFLTSSKGEKN